MKYDLAEVICLTDIDEDNYSFQVKSSFFHHKKYEDLRIDIIFLLEYDNAGAIQIFRIHISQFFRTGFLGILEVKYIAHS